MKHISSDSVQMETWYISDLWERKGLDHRGRDMNSIGFCFVVVVVPEIMGSN